MEMRSTQLPAILFCVLFSAGCLSESPDAPDSEQMLTASDAPVKIDGGFVEPLSKDVATLDGIISAYYEIVSGPAGQARDRMRDKSIHDPNARAIITSVDSEGNRQLQNMTVDEYHDRFGAGESAFYEKEIHRVTQQFGAITHVWSTYAWTTEPDGELGGRGINSIQLYFDNERWWVMNWIFDSERPDNKIPTEYLN